MPRQSLPELQTNTAMRRSVQEFPDVDGGAPRISTIFQVATAADEAPVWWSPARDQYLDKFWPTEPFLSGAIFSIASRNAAFRYELTGPRNQVIWAQQLLSQADFGDGWQSFIMKVTLDLLCLGPNSTIMLGGDRRGKRKQVRDMVLEKDKGPVLTADADGKLTERKVTGWYKTKLGGRRWMWLSLKHSSHHGRGGKRGGLWMTHDHRVLTPDGWVEVQHLSRGDEVVSGFPAPSFDQECVITGMMLGDGSMRQLHGVSSTMLKLGHSAKQSEWLKLKVASLNGFGWTPLCMSKRKRPSYIHGRLIKDNGHISCDSHCTPGLADIYEAWYPDGKKHVSREMVERCFSPIMLATWYMDDGSLQKHHSKGGKLCRPGVNIYTNGFDKADVEWLASLLTRRGFRAEAWPLRSREHRTYWYIHMNVDAAEEFLKVIAPYVLPSMRYKLPDGLPKFDEGLWDVDVAESFIDVVESVEEKPLKTGFKYVSQATYCIDVEDTHNFAVSGVIVHNCQGNGTVFETVRPARIRTKTGMYDAIKAFDEDTGDYLWQAYDRRTGKLQPRSEFVDGFKVLDSPLDLPIGIAHLDAQKCVRSGDPNFPIVYTDLKGKAHKLASHQVVTMTEMPSPREDMRGVQHCLVDRALRLSQTLRDMLIYKHEKISGRFARAIYLTNIDAQLIQDAIDQSKANADNRGLIRYMQPIIATTLKPDARPAVATIELASLPDGFDEETTMRWYIAGLALAAGVDYGFLAPLPGNRLGTATQAETQERQAKGKSSRLFLNALTHKLNFSGILPRNVTIRFAVPDPYEESERDRALARRARARSIMIKSGEITPEMARQIAADVGDIDSKYLEAMGEVDVTPIITVGSGEIPRRPSRRRRMAQLPLPQPEQQQEGPA